MRIEGNRVVFSRERPDGQSSYVMEVDVLAGELQTTNGISFAASADGTLKIWDAVAEEPVFAHGRVVTGGIVKSCGSKREHMIRRPWL